MSENYIYKTGEISLYKAKLQSQKTERQTKTQKIRLNVGTAYTRFVDGENPE